MKNHNAFCFMSFFLKWAIEYLFKEDFDNSTKEKQWVRISGGIYKNTLITLIKKFDKWFFSDSIFQLCCREPDVEGYFAYDEHGVFYIYDKEVKDTLLKLEFSSSTKKELLSEKPHWHVRPKDAEATLARFKQEIKNESVFCNDEADKDELRREVKPKEQ